MNPTKSSEFFFLTLPKSLFALFVILTILAILLPLNPGMPHSGRDPSWIYSMNEAVAKKMEIGKEIIFTFGPYASIYTRMYYPATDHLMIFSGLLLGLGYSAALLYLTKDKKPYFLLVFLAFLVGYGTLPLSIVFFSYPLILAACAFKFIRAIDHREKLSPNFWEVLAFGLLFVPMGLLPLIKGSFLLLCGATTGAISIYGVYHRYYLLAGWVLISLVISIVILWSLSGQPLPDLPGYFSGMFQMVSGYTEAMALKGKRAEINAYLLSAAVTLWALARSAGLVGSGKLFLGASVALFLFICFKSGFVRHDAHAAIAAGALLAATLIISFIYWDKRLVVALAISIISWRYIGHHYTTHLFEKILMNIRNTYVDAWDGLSSRIMERQSLPSRFEQSLEEIREERAIPALQGTTDIYSTDQAYLLASHNQWNPRPTMQSYAAYTDELATANEQHLRGNHAPDNVLFRVQPIDGHLPSLEDGLSWPALFDNYVLTKLEGDWVYLRKKSTIRNRSVFDPIYEGVYKTGEEVTLPQANLPLYAEIDLRPTFIGRLLGIVFKPPQLKLTLKLKNGASISYRVVSNMMKSGFFISPLIQSTEGFALLATGHLSYLQDHVVESVAITPSYGKTIFWKGSYMLRLKAYRGITVTRLPEHIFSRMLSSSPKGYTEAAPVRCDGVIDFINGLPPISQMTDTTGLLSVEGWLAVSGKDGIVPDDIFVTLKNPDGITQYVLTQRVPRNDVKNYFKHPRMPNVGYISTVDVTALKGTYALGLASGYKGQLKQCGQFNIPISIEER